MAKRASKRVRSEKHFMPPMMDLDYVQHQSVGRTISLIDHMTYG
jgi:hypothetical protein